MEGGGKEGGGREVAASNTQGTKSMVHSMAEDRGEASCNRQPAPEAELYQLKLDKLAADAIAEADAREEALAGEEQTGLEGKRQ
jgi:hypothetical protein